MPVTRQFRLVLASGSKARHRVLRDAGFDPEVMVSRAAETTESMDTRRAVIELAERKGRLVAKRCTDALVIACDSLLDVDGESIGKPANRDEAVRLCRRLSGSQAVLYTGHWLCDVPSGLSISDVAGTIVYFGRPTDEEIEAYVSTGEPLRMAGAFSIEGDGAPFIDGIEGDPSNVLGLSLPLFRRMLSDLDIRVIDLWRRGD